MVISSLHCGEYVSTQPFSIVFLEANWAYYANVLYFGFPSGLVLNVNDMYGIFFYMLTLQNSDISS